MSFINELKKVLEENSGKISASYIEQYLNDKNTKVTHSQITPSIRVCVISLSTGYELVGYSQVLDSKNDVELIGQKVAYENAKEQIWSVFGSIAKIIN